MAKAVWHNQVIAQSDTGTVVEGNYYFPPESVQCEFLEPSDTRTQCGWKGEAHYYHLVVDGQKNRDAAWFYPEPKTEAEGIKNYIAFWNGVEVKDSAN